MTIIPLSIREPESQCQYGTYDFRLALAHETSHAWHYVLDRNGNHFSNRWLERFPLQREEGWSREQTMKENGLFSVEGSWDYTRDPDCSVLLPENRGRYFPRDEFGVSLYTTRQKDEWLLDLADKAVASLPPRLRDMVSILNIDADLIPMGYALINLERVDDDYKRCTEDVATSASTLLYATEYPDQNHQLEWVLDLVRPDAENPKPRERLEVLTEWGFIPPLLAEHMLAGASIADVVAARCQA